MLKWSLLAERRPASDVLSHYLPLNYPKETKMKSALIGAAAVAAAAFATPAMAQTVIEDPGYCAQFYPSVNCPYPVPGIPYADGGFRRNKNTVMLGTRQSRPGSRRTVTTADRSQTIDDADLPVRVLACTVRSNR